MELSTRQSSMHQHNRHAQPTNPSRAGRASLLAWLQQQPVAVCWAASKLRQVHFSCCQHVQESAAPLVAHAEQTGWCCVAWFFRSVIVSEIV
jgi:hypothetical protein